MVANPRLESWQSLHQQLRGIAKRRAALDAEEARCLRDADAMKLWRRLGYVHMAEYLERELGYGPQVAAERLRVARELGELPQTEAGLAAGTLSYSAIRELTRIATTATEAEWLAESRGKNLRQIEAMVSGRKRGDRPCDPTRPDLVARVVRIELLPHVFALFRQAQGAMADEHGGRLDDNAFIEALCRRALEGDRTSARPAHQIAITVCESCKRGWQNGGGQEIEVDAEVIARAECDAEWIGSLEAEQPARVTASVTPRIRRQVLARDHHRCTVPGCRSARNLDLHHIEYQCEGGAHELWNVTTTCSGHHRQLHEGALTIRGKAPDALEFAWRDGRASWRDEPDVDHERGEVPSAEALGVGNPAVERPTMGDVEALTDQGAMSRGTFATGAGSAGQMREPATTTEPHNDRVIENPTIHAALDTTENTADDSREPTTAKFQVGDRIAKGRGSRSTLAAAARNARDGREPTTANSHVGDRATLGRTTDKIATATRCMAQAAADRPVESPSAGDEALTQLLCDARAALTTAGYKAHEARAAVEIAQSQLDDDVTLPLLIRKALQCCATARAG